MITFKLKTFGSLGDLDKRSIEAQNNITRKSANFQKKIIDKIGLGDTKVGRKIKSGIDEKAEYRINQANEGLEFRRKHYKYDN